MSESEGLKLFEFEEAFVQIEPKGKKYYLKELTAKLHKEIAEYDEKALKGDREAQETQLHLLTGIPTEILSKMAQWKLNQISKYCVEKNVERKKKDEKKEKSD